jgi:hypothetical protein
MNILRRVLGIFVMVAGLIGLLLSLAGLFGLWYFRPVVVASVDATIATLTSSVDTSQRAMEITNQALGATVASVDALSAMLNATAKSVEDTKPMMDQVNIVMGVKMPAMMEATTASIKTSQEAAASMEETIQTLDTFRTAMSASPFVGAFVPASEKKYDPEKPLAVSLGEVAASLEDMPAAFIEMAVSMDNADNNLEVIQANLTTMSQSVSLISGSLRDYQVMIGQSQGSMEDLKVMLSGIQENLYTILNGLTIVLGLLIVWMLAVQVVVFSQGWELYHGTAGRMEGAAPAAPASPAPAAEAPVG